MKLPSVPQATASGVVCGCAAVLFWLAVTGWPATFVIPYTLALAATLLCGGYVLLATCFDWALNPRRGTRIRPIRGFDLFVGLLLTALPLWSLWPFLGAF
jgi:hypothetical protein